MRLDQPNQSASLVKSLLISLAMIAVMLFAPPNAWGQQGPDETSNELEAQKKPEPKKSPGLFENIRGSFDFAGLIREVRGDKPGKFQETRHFPQGFSLRNLHLKFESADSPYFLNFKALEIRERDQRFSAEVGRVGRYQTRFMWDQIPRDYDKGRTLHVLTAPGFLSVNQVLRAALEAVPDAGGAPDLLGPQLPALVIQAVAAAPTIGLRVRWDQLLVTQSYRPSENWEFYFSVQHLRLNGTRPRETGTFARRNQFPTGQPAPLNFDGIWETLGAELPEPVSEHTTNLAVGFQYSRPKWRVGVDYSLSLFRNNVPTLTWENPFRVTDALSNNPPTFNLGRNRFVRAQLAEAPDNDYQSLSVRGSVDLPRETQLRAEFAWGRGTQNQAFLPYTLNSAMTVAGLTAISPLLTGQPGLFGLALPRPSLNGKVRTLNGDVALSTKPWHNMRFLFQYRADDMQNQSPIVTFPGLPLFGDSTVRTAIDNYGLAMENFPTSYTRHDTTATWQWDVNNKLGFEAEYNWEIWNRKFRDVPKSNEHSVQGRFDYKPWRGVSLKGEYLYSHRIPRSYLTQPLLFNPNLNVGSAAAPFNGGPGWEATLAQVAAGAFIRGLPNEFNQLRRFDEADRIRKDGGISLEVARSEKLNYSISWRYLRDDYDKNFWGLHYGVQSTVDAQLNYFPKGGHQDDSGEGGWEENTFFYANYSREQDQTGYRAIGNLINGAGTNVRACCAQYPINNSWDRSSRIKLDMFQFGFSTASKGEKTAVDLSYGLGFARDKTTTVNPFPILAISPRTAGTYPYPDVINRQQDLNLTVTQQLRPDLILGFNYRYEPYRLSDYYTNSLVPYAPTQVAGGNLGSNTPRQLFLDARFTSYHANVGTVFLRYTF